MDDPIEEADFNQCVWQILARASMCSNCSCREERQLDHQFQLRMQQLCDVTTVSSEVAIFALLHYAHKFSVVLSVCNFDLRSLKCCAEIFIVLRRFAQNIFIRRVVCEQLTIHVCLLKFNRVDFNAANYYVSLFTFQQFLQFQSK